MKAVVCRESLLCNQLWVICVSACLLMVSGSRHLLGQVSTSMHGGQELLTCSPSPCVLPPIQASEGGAEVTDTPIIADPLNPLRLLLGSDDANCPGAGVSGFHLSNDGGSSWTVYCMPNLHFQNRIYYPGGEPMVAYDLNGVAYIADGFGDSEGLGYGLLAVQKSTDGVNWSAPVVALSEGFSEPLYSWMTADTSASSPYLNTLYASAVVIDEPGQVRTQVVVSHSNDEGNTWRLAPVDPQQKAPAADFFTHLSVGKNGTLYVSWEHCLGKPGGQAAGCSNGKAFMLFSKSSDGGNTWSAPVLMASVTLNNSACQCGISGLPNTNNIRVYNYPVIGIDNSSGPYAGNLYAVMHSWTGTHLQVQVVRSNDDGDTWSKPVLVAPASETHDQFFPGLSVSPTGPIGVSWLDRRNDPANIDYQAFAAISTDGGKSFQPNIVLTQNFSNPNNNGFIDNLWMGDYSGNTWDGPDYFIAAWMDSSNGVDMQEEVGGIRLK